MLKPTPAVRNAMATDWYYMQQSDHIHMMTVTGHSQGGGLCQAFYIPVVGTESWYIHSQAAS